MGHQTIVPASGKLVGKAACKLVAIYRLAKYVLDVIRPAAGKFARSR